MNIETNLANQISKVDELLSHYKLSSVERQIFILTELITNRFDGLEERLDKMPISGMSNGTSSFNHEVINQRLDKLELLFTTLFPVNLHPVPDLDPTPESELQPASASAALPDSEEFKRLTLHTREIFSLLKSAMAKRSGEAS